jgi:hypothetical protein
MRSSTETNKAKHMTKQNRQLREIYLLAAEKTAETWNYCCPAIHKAATHLQVEDEGDHAKELFQFLYKPSPCAQFYWLRDELGYETCQENRILALLFMAELARTDSLPTLSEIQSA